MFFLTQKTDVREPGASDATPGGVFWDRSKICLLAGMALYWTCSSISRNDYVIFRRTSSANDVYVTLFVFLGAMIVAGLSFFLLRRPLEKLLLGRFPVVPLLSAGASLALLPMLYMDPGSSPSYWPLRVLSCCVLVAWYLVITFAWCSATVALGVRRGITTVVLTYMLGCLLSPLFTLPSPWHDGFEIAAPTLSGLLWLWSPERQPEDISYSPSSLQNFPVPAIVLCGVFYCASGSLRDYVGYENFEAAQGFQELVPTIVNAGSALVLFVALKIGFRKGTSWQSFYTALVVAVIFFFGCLFAVVLGRVPLARGGEVLISASYMCFKLLLWMFIVVVASESNVSVVTAFSLFFVTVATAFMFIVGTALPTVVHLAGIDIYQNRQTTLLVAAFALIAVTLLVMLQYISANERSVVDASHQTSRHEALETIAQAHRLTPREVDVASLVLQGHSIKMVAKLLYISDGTVQTHMKNLYRKLDLHSKQELIALVDGATRNG